MTKWKRVSSLTDLLAFSSGRTIEKQEDTYYVDGIKIPRHVSKPKTAVVTFADGAQMACVSAIEWSGGCSTCGDEGAWTGFFVRAPERSE